MQRRTRGLLAALILLAATIGLPLALAETIGDPLSSWTSIRAGQASDQAVTAILAAVFYLAWLSFVIPVVVEIASTVVAHFSRRPSREIRLPLLGPQQDLARTLISAVLLLVPTAASATGSHTPHPAPATAAATLSSYTESAAHHAPDTDRLGRHTAGADRASATDRTYVIPEVGGMRSYWALAEHYLGDGQRWREIWTLNAGRVHTDGTVMDTPRRLFAGWTILIPPTAPQPEILRPLAAHHDVTVHPGNTLSGLAAVDGITDWHQVWPANADRVEPDGQRLVNPNLIRPGWTVTLPDMTSTRTHTDINGRGPSKNGTQRQHPHRETRPNATAQPHAANTPPAAASAPATLPASAPAEPGNAKPTGSPAPSSHHPQGEAAPSHDPLPVPLEIGLAAAAAVAVLDRARRIAQRRRRRGHRPLPPPQSLRQFEAKLRRDARDAHPAVAAIQLATALISGSPPPIHAVIARDDGAVDLIVGPTASEAPPPFIEIPGGWRLPADATGFGYAVEDTDDPYPALAPIGRTDDGQVLIDLATGPIGVVGDAGKVQDFLAQLVAAIVGAPWSDRLQLRVPAELAEQIGPLEHVVAEDTTSPVPAVDLFASSTYGVKREPEEPGWCTTPVYLYCGWTVEDNVDPLLRASLDPARHVHAVINGPHPSTTHWSLDGNQLTVPHLSAPVTVAIPNREEPAACDVIAFTAAAPHVPVGDPRLPDLVVDAPPDPKPRPGQLMLLGPIELSGSGKLRRAQMLNVLAYLALHRRGVDRHQLVAALWPDKVVSQQTLRNRMTEARMLVGGALSDGPVWRLDESVTTDWQQFSALATGTPDEQHQALALIRGRPFTGLDTCDWLDLEGFRSEVEAAIVDLALTVGERDLANGDPSAALAAARAGLLASRYEERLHRLAIRAADSAGRTGVVKTLKQEMRVVLDLDIEPDDEVQPETLALYEQMRARRSVGSDSPQR